MAEFMQFGPGTLTLLSAQPGPLASTADLQGFSTDALESWDTNTWAPVLQLVSRFAGSNILVFTLRKGPCLEQPE